MSSNKQYFYVRSKVKIEGAQNERSTLSSDTLSPPLHRRRKANFFFLVLKTIYGDRNRIKIKVV